MDKATLDEISQKLIGCKQNEPMNRYTTLNIGGPADLFFISKTPKELEKAIKVALKHKIPYFVLGSGSNILVSDKGFRGLVIKNTASKHKIVDKNPSKKLADTLSTSKVRLDQPDSKKYLEFSDLHYDESGDDRVLVRVESGITTQRLFNYLIKDDITGLQWFGGIPGTVGGATYMNIHGGDQFFGDVLYQATILDKKGNKKEVGNNYFDFDYDQSKIQETDDTVLSMDLLLFKGDVTKAKETFKEWTRRKTIQPRNSSGSVFKTLAEETKNELGFPTGSAGYVLDQVLDLKGTRIGDAMVSERHANFIENAGNATAKDYKGLIDICKQKTKEKLGIELEEEIEYIGDWPH